MGGQGVGGLRGVERDDRDAVADRAQELIGSGVDGDFGGSHSEFPVFPRNCEERSERRFHGEWIATKSEARLRLLKPLNLETTMLLDHPFVGLTAIRTHIAAIFMSLELSRSNWLVTSLSPGKGEKM